MALVKRVVHRARQALAVGRARVIARILPDVARPVVMDGQALAVAGLGARHLFPFLRVVSERAVGADCVGKLLAVHACPLLSRRVSRCRIVAHSARVAHGVVPGVAHDARPDTVL